MIEGMRELRIGPNLNYIEADLVYTVLGGFTDAKVATEYIALVTAVQREYGQVFTIIDNQKNQSMDPGARRLLFEFARKNLVSASATIGGGPVYRTMLTLLIRALNLVKSKICPTGFFATEAEARAWMDGQRRRGASADHRHL